MISKNNIIDNNYTLSENSFYAEFNYNGVLRVILCGKDIYSITTLQLSQLETEKKLVLLKIDRAFAYSYIIIG